MTKRTIILVVLVVLLVGVGFLFGLMNEGVRDSLKGLTLPMPDLKIEELEVKTENPTAGKQLMFVVKVKNKGSEQAGKFVIRVTDTDSGVKGFGAGKVLASGDEVLINVAVETSGVAPGEHVFAVEVDFKNEVAEGNEANNTEEVEVSLKSAME